MNTSVRNEFIERAVNTSVRTESIERAVNASVRTEFIERAVNASVRTELVECAAITPVPTEPFGKPASTPPATFAAPVASRGFTLVELLVAIVMTSFVVASVFFSWNRINTHISKQRRQSLFLSDITTFANSLAIQVRTSPKIIYYDETTIEFIPRHQDTPVRYQFSYDELLKNDQPVRLSSQGAIITDFLIESDAYYEEDLPMILLNLTIHAENSFGDTHEITVSAAVEPPKDDEDDGGWGW